MLVLTRKVGETLIVGNTIRIKVIGIASNVVRLGFDAPAEVSIYREEVYREIAAANKAVLEEASGPDAPTDDEADPSTKGDPESE